MNKGSILHIEVSGLKEVIAKFKNFPKHLNSLMKKTMVMSLQEIRKHIPVYTRTSNPAPPSDRYTRTFNLGRSLGMGSGTTRPDIYNVVGSGQDVQGKYGTRVPYAKYVVDAKRQAYMHRGRWWTLDNVNESARPFIQKLWDAMVKRILG